MFELLAVLHSVNDELTAVEQVGEAPGSQFIHAFRLTRLVDEHACHAVIEDLAKFGVSVGTEL